MEKEIKEKETKKKMSIYEKLLNIQQELKAPKNQYNSFGEYKYRSCEDILEAVKPLLKEYKVVLFLTDTIVPASETRFYIKSIAVLHDTESDARIENTAYARETEEKKKLDASQLSGVSSSYARKYALNGLFLIDDTKDADTDEYVKEQEKKTKKEVDYRKQLIEYCNKNEIDMNEIAKEYNLSGSSKQEDFKKVLDTLNAK